MIKLPVLAGSTLNFSLELSTRTPYTSCMVNNIDSFLCEVQLEELYDEQVLQEMNEFYEALNKQEHEQEPNQN